MSEVGELSRRVAALEEGLKAIEDVAQYGSSTLALMVTEHRPAIGLSSAGRHTLCMGCGEPWPCRSAVLP